MHPLPFAYRVLMHFEPNRRRIIAALALVQLAIIGTMITAVTWRHDGAIASAAPAAGDSKPALRHKAIAVGDDPHVVIDASNFAVEIDVGADGKVVFDDLSEHAGAILAGHRAIDITETDDGVKIAASENDAVNLGISDLRLRITVPKSSKLEITDCASASIANLTGGVQVTSGNGRVLLTNLAAATVEVDAGNGRVEAKGIKAESLTIHASNGKVIAQNISIAGEDPKLEFTASNGKIEFTGRLAPGGTYSMESSNGSVTVGLPDDSDTTVTAAAANGSVRAGEGIALREDGDNKVATFGAGRGALSVSTSNGSISIQRTDGVEHGR